MHVQSSQADGERHPGQPGVETGPGEFDGRRRSRVVGGEELLEVRSDELLGLGDDNVGAGHVSTIPTS